MTLTSNAANVLAARVVAAVANLGLAVLIASRIGSSGFGTFAALIAGGAVANLIVTFGIDLVVVRAVADRREDAITTIGRALALQVLGAGACVVAAGVAVVTGAVSPLLLLPAISLVPLGVTTVASAIIRGAQQMRGLLVGSVLSSAAALGVAAVVVDQGVAGAVVAVLVGQIVNAAVLASLARGHVVAIAGRADRSEPVAVAGKTSILVGLPALASESWVFAVATVAGAMMAQGALITFEVLSTGNSGALAAGLRLTEAARMVPAAAFAALFPAMFDGIHRSATYRRWFAAIVAYAVLAVVGLAALAPWLSRWLFDDPPQGSLVIRIVAVGLIATVFRLRYSFELIAAGRERVVMNIAVATTTLALIGYGLGAMTDRLVMAAAAQVIAITVNAIWLGVEVRRRDGRSTATDVRSAGQERWRF